MSRCLLACLPLFLLTLACADTTSPPRQYVDARPVPELAPGPNVGKPQTADWPQWRGPERNGHSKETGLLQAWPKDGPKLLWTMKDLGEGYTTPSVAAGRIFLMSNRRTKGRPKPDEYVVALNDENGKELWATVVGPERANGGGYPGPRCTPTVDGDRVYALGLNGDLLCLESTTGREVWRKDLVKDFGGSPGGWGYCESPLVDGDRVIVTPGGRKATLAALDKKTGKELWRAAVPEGDSAGYSSAVAAEVDGVKMVVQFLSGGVVGVAANDGKFLWRYDAPANSTANCATPIVQDGHVFATSSYGKGGGLVKLVRDGERFKAEEVWFEPQFENHHGNAVLVDGHVYGEGGSQLVCLEWKTGEVKWREGKPGKGSISFADGRLYYRSEGGQMTLVEANPKKYVEAGRFKQPDRSSAPSWPHPVIANGRLYLRDQDVLLCYSVVSGQ